MIIWVDDDLFNTGALDVDRITLLRGAAKRRHTLMIAANPRDPRTTRQAPAFMRWKDSLGEKLRTEVDLLMQRLAIVTANAVARGAERLLVSSREWPGVSGCRISLEEAIRAVVLPTYVLVENAINDAAFLRHSMPPRWRERLINWECEGLLRYEHGGGNTQMRNIINYHANDENCKRAFGLPSRLWRIVHVVVHDHDGPSAEGAKELEKACDAAGMSRRSHRLLRKDAEHYLPREALEAIIERKFKTESGDWRAVSSAIEQHFSANDDRHFRPLPNSDSFKNAFGKYDTQIDWDVNWFARDGAWQEMTLLAEMIAAAI